MAFPKEIAERALVACGRHCSLCHRFCGIKIELHHMVQVSEGGGDTFENCIPLCFDCHAEVKAYNPKHPKGRNFSVPELTAHRDRWYEKVKGSGIVQTEPKYRKLDLEVWNKLLEFLPPSGAIGFIRDHNFAFSFKTDMLDQLHAVSHHAEYHPDFEFIDADLEGLRSELITKVGKFLSVVGLKTYPKRGVPGINEVPEEWEHEQTERFWEAVNELHSLTTEITNTYDALVRLARRKLLSD